MDCNGLPKYAVLDGGMATELIRLGHQHIDADPMWSSCLLNTNVEAVKQAHHNFLTAGADVIETNTYQASIEGFQKHMNLTAEQACQLVTTGVELAKSVRDEFWTVSASEDVADGMKSGIRPLVAGSVGPYGARLHDCSEYTGAYVETLTMEELAEKHRPMVKLFLESGVDLVAIDTIPAQKEAEALAYLLKDYPSARAWISFSCQDGERICHGEKFLDAVTSLLHSEQIFGVGINCSAPHNVSSLLRQIHPIKDQKTIVVYPNNGKIWGKGYKWDGKEDLLSVDHYVPEWLELGANWIGGCCNISPDDIVKIRTALHSALATKIPN